MRLIPVSPGNSPVDNPINSPTMNITKTLVLASSGRDKMTASDIRVPIDKSIGLNHRLFISYSPTYNFSTYKISDLNADHLSID